MQVVRDKPIAGRYFDRVVAQVLILIWLDDRVLAQVLTLLYLDDFSEVSLCPQNRTTLGNHFLRAFSLFASAPILQSLAIEAVYSQLDL